MRCCAGASLGRGSRLDCGTAHGTAAAALVLALGAAVTKVGTFLPWFITSAETGHAAGAFIVLTGRTFFQAFIITTAAAFSLFRNGSAGGGGATRSVALVQRLLIEALLTPAETPAQRLGFFKAVGSIIPSAT